MASLKNYQTEITLSIVALIYLWFILTNSNIQIGTVYLWTIGISLFLLLINVLIFDKNVRVTFQKEKGKWAETIFAGVIGWVLILIASFLLFNFVNPIKANFSSIMALLNAANPIFSDSQFLNLITISFAVGFGETVLFSRILEHAADRLNIPISRDKISNVKFILLAIFLAILFAIFHATAKGLGISPGAINSLLIVAVMMFVSIMMMAYFNGETRQAVITHITANFVAGALVLYGGGSLIL